jgi:hypothetical protein
VLHGGQQAQRDVSIAWYIVLYSPHGIEYNTLRGGCRLFAFNRTSGTTALPMYNIREIRRRTPTSNLTN